MKRFLIFVGILLLVTMLFVPTAVADGQNGTTLIDASATVTPHWTRTFGWTIGKSVTPGTWNLFQGDSGTSQYTVAVTKDAGTDEAWVDGQISVTNGGAEATENLAITALLKDGVPPPNDVVGTLDVDVSGNPVLDPGETGNYNYSIPVPMPPHAGGTYKVTANITITNHSGSLGTPSGPSPSNAATWPASPTLVNDTINVDDTNGGSWAFNSGGSVSYDKTFAPIARGTAVYNNTATIRETGQTDSASVTVNCYVLVVTKSVNTSLTRTYNWTIDKSADQSSLTLAPNQVFSPVNYSVKVDATPTDSDWGVSGLITVGASGPIPATINKISDVVSDAIQADVTCGVELPYTLDEYMSIECSYTAALPDAANRTNTATATLQNYSYDSEMNATPSGTTDFSSVAEPVNFAGATVNKVDESIDVSDTYTGSLGTVTSGVDTIPKTFTYSRTVGPYTASGDYTVDNTASFVTNDTEATGSDSWTVNVNVPSLGATLTIGYWKNHAGFGPQNDMVTALLPIWLGTSFDKSFLVTNPALAVQYLSFSGSNDVFDASNGINKLYAQLLAAKLNIKNGADDSAVAKTIAAADAFLETHDSTSWSALTKKEKNQVLIWATTLDNYNNGIIGPGHADI
jgi:hypothetical protein